MDSKCETARPPLEVTEIDPPRASSSCSWRETCPVPSDGYAAAIEESLFRMRVHGSAEGAPSSEAFDEKTVADEPRPPAPFAGNAEPTVISIQTPFDGVPRVKLAGSPLFALPRAPAIENDATEVSPPIVVDKYVICDLISSGGMGSVHFARMIGPKGASRVVAVKRLHPHLARDAEFSRMLVSEAHLAACIRHPNVVSTLEVVRQDDELLLVMEYVHGISLAALLSHARKRNETLPPALIAAVLVDTLHGLHAAHEARGADGHALAIVHRDISPDNILIGSDGIARIADFGIAKAYGVAKHTEASTLKGKLAYMAPEQVQRQPVTRAADLFAATVVLWEALTGQSLFVGANMAEMVFKKLCIELPSARSIVPELPEALDALVTRGLARAPEERFATALEMVAALEACVTPMCPSEVHQWLNRFVADELAASAKAQALVEGRVPIEASVKAPANVDPPAPVVVPRAQEAVRSEVTSDRDRHERSRHVFALAALAIIALATVAIVALASTASADAPRAAPESSGAVDVSAAPPVPSDTPKAAASASPPDPTPHASASASSNLSPGPRRIPPSTRLPVRLKAAPAPITDARDCDPPYVFNRDGTKHFRLECL